MGERLTLEEFARRAGEPAERIEEWRAHGLIGSEDGFGPEDLGRARLVHDLLHYGHSVEQVAEVFHRQDSGFRHFLEELGQGISQARFTLDEAAERLGIDLETARKVMEASGLSVPDELLDDEDVQCLRSCKIALDAGYPEEALLQVLRVYSDAMGRAAEVGARTSHFYIHRPLLDQELPPGEVVQQLHDTFDKVEPLILPALLYFYRKGALRASWDDMLMHLEEEAGLADKPEIPGQVRQAILFVDLANFTPLAEAMGDLRAAQVLQRFAEIVRSAVRRNHGRIVKQIGDAFMIVFPECFSAVSCALELERRSAEEPQFPAMRSGIHWGPVLYREGDYLGSNVNIASRLGTEAERHQTLVTDEVRRRAKGMEGVEFIRLGKRRLKGLATEVEVFEARATGPEAQAKVLDPVCGMELGPGEIAARLTLNGREQSFCSDECLRKFVAAPEKYGG